MYRKQSKNNLSTKREFIWLTRLTKVTTKLLQYLHHHVCISESIRESAETTVLQDIIFTLAINRPSFACSMLITATFYVMGIDLNTSKTSHDSLISIAVIVKT